MCYPPANGIASTSDSSDFNAMGANNFIRCDIDGENLSCNNDFGGGTVVHYNLRHSSGTHHYEFTSEPTITSNNYFVNSIMENEDMESFVRANDSKGWHEKIGLLAALASMVPYDYDGLLTPNGSGAVNDISLNEMYRRTRTSTFSSSLDTPPATVCRGIANLVTNIASRWGFEAHSISLHTSGLNHVLTMLRYPGHPYVFINYETVVPTNARSQLEAVELLARELGYPPQLNFISYGPDGKFERFVETNEGKMLREVLTPTEEISDYLMFRK